VSSGRVRNLVGGIPEERRHSKFRVIFADIKEVETSNSKLSAK